MKNYLLMTLGFMIGVTEGLISHIGVNEVLSYSTSFLLGIVIVLTDYKLGVGDE